MPHIMENMSQFILRQETCLQHEKSNGPTNEAFWGFDNVLLGYCSITFSLPLTFRCEFKGTFRSCIMVYHRLELTLYAEILHIKGINFLEY